MQTKIIFSLLKINNNKYVQKYSLSIYRDMTMTLKKNIKRLSSIISREACRACHTYISTSTAISVVLVFWYYKLQEAITLSRHIPIILYNSHIPNLIALTFPFAHIVLILSRISFSTRYNFPSYIQATFFI